MKKLLKSLLLVGLGAVVCAAGFSFRNSLPVVEWVGSSYAGSFEIGYAGPLAVKCRERCNGATFPYYCKGGCDYYYNVLSNWIGRFDNGDAGPAWVKCKDKCTAGWGSSGKNLLCNLGCDYSFNIISNW